MAPPQAREHADARGAGKATVSRQTAQTAVAEEAEAVAEAEAAAAAAAAAGVAVMREAEAEAEAEAEGVVAESVLLPRVSRGWGAAGSASMTASSAMIGL